MRLKRAGVKGVGLSRRLVRSQRVVRRIHKRGWKLFVWTVNRGAEMKKLAGWGVDGLITNHPDVTKSCLARPELPLCFDRMLQIIFNPVSAKELAALPRKLQLEIIDGFQLFPQDFEKDDEKFGQLTRAGKKIYRYRVKDYRIYFERNGDIIDVRCILNKNSRKDFFFRSKLPISEDQLLQDNPKFWQLLGSSAEK